MPVRGFISYGGLYTQQHDNAFEVFRAFLQEVRPARILEIGTAGGGFTLFLRETLDSLGLESSMVRSYDIAEHIQYGRIRSPNLEIRIENIFDPYTRYIVKQQDVVDFIRGEGTTLVLCDGGHKPGEFNLLAPYLKVGDYIMAHDYVETWQEYKDNFVDQIWNWCEIEERHIEKVSKEQNLEKAFHWAEEFAKVVWVCKQKRG